MSRRKHNLEQIRRYLCVVRAKLERPTNGVLNMEEVLSNGSRPESKPPIPEHALSLLAHEDNAASARLINPALTWLSQTHGHLHYISRLAERDPARTRRWFSPETEDDATEARMFEEALSLLEEYVEYRAPGVRLNVAISPDDEPAESRKEAAYRDRKADTASADASIVAQLSEIEERTGLPRERAKLQLVADRERTTHPIGVDRIRRAIQRTNASSSRHTSP